ncbi:hypothetical protein EMPS_04643 [Entomortierella parvispora]|uniref:Dienelactone hydrolase domain-containing protein n=1 Tax=Entomortierella parvispora TaxID=205924 RepID=A0A9P3H901_9FUNG|nr:hypothetical protein EMPS_04643 [Entomortierella parvispora]
MSDLTEACCNASTTATETVWQNKGEFKPLHVEGHQDKTYRTGPKSATTGIIGVYDILGYSATGLQFFDRLALAHNGYQVSVPNMFREAGQAPSHLFKDPEERMAWMGQHCSYGAPAHLDALIRAAVEDLRKDGCTHFVIYGQCWGAWKALEAAADSTMPFLATGGPHPSRMSEELMRASRCPVILLPASNDDNMEPLIAVANEKNLKVKSVQHRFDTMRHGWTGARGDWSIPDQRKCAEEVIELLASFTDKVVNASKT